MDTQYLSIDFNNETVVLQYHPESISLTVGSSSNTVVGLNNLITNVANPNTSIASISIAAKFTALEAVTQSKQITRAELIAGTELARGGLASALSLTSGVGVTSPVLESAQNTIACAKGVIDLTTGLITSNTQINRKVTFNEKKLGYLKTLRNALDRTTPATINWDISTQAMSDSRKYYLHGLSIDTRVIQAETGSTTVFDLRMDFRQFGDVKVFLGTANA